MGGFIGWGLFAASLMISCGTSIFAGWLVVGSSVGVAQYLVISRKLNSHRTTRIGMARPGIWIPVTVLGVLLSVLTQSELPAMLYSLNRNMDVTAAKSLGYISGGLIYGLLQALALKRPVRGVLFWSLACALGWSIGTVIGLTAARTAVNWLIGYNYDFGSESGPFLVGAWDALFIAIEGGVGTAIFAVITGLFLSPLRSPVLAIPDSRGKPQTEQNDPA
jgi:hypothetical protein